MQIRIPCECGRELTAEPTQAGLQLKCTCGRTVQVPPWRRPLSGADNPLPQPARSGLTALGWTFLLLGAAAVATAGLATDTLGLEPGPGRKFFRLLLGGGALIVVAVIGALLRVLGARFFRS
jgi:hypothetical protein